MSKVTVPQIVQCKGQKKLSALTAYDYLFAKILNDQKVDIILVGDSLSSVFHGDKNTTKVTLEQMIYHSKAVSSACDYSLLVCDLPFMTYQESNSWALQNAGKVIQEGQAEAVKLEGGVEVAERIQFLTQYGIPVMGHIGLTPQSVHQLGGHKIQGRDGKSVKSSSQILADAFAVQEAGAFAVVLECMPDDLAQEITTQLKIPTIGIGAGQQTDGQILVTHDLLGLGDRKPSFVKFESDLKERIQGVVQEYISSI